MLDKQRDFLIHFNALKKTLNFHICLTADPPTDSTLYAAYSVAVLTYTIATAVMDSNNRFRYSGTCPADRHLLGNRNKNKRYTSRVPLEGCHDQSCEDLR
jgi:hypothetical protein